MMAPQHRDNNAANPAPLDLWPHNVDAEMAVLGCVLDPTLPDALAIIADTLHITASDFYRLAHQLIYQTALDLRAAHTPTDFITVGDALDYAGKLEDVGDTAYVSSLCNYVPPSGDPTAYAEIVKRCATQRRGMELSGQLAKAARLGDFADVARVQSDLAALLTERAPAAVDRFRLLTDEEVEALPMPKMLVDGLLVRNTLAMIYGDTGTYKSFFAVDLALRIATGCDWYGHATQRGPVVYVAAEGAPGMAKRVRAWKNRYQVPPGPTGLYFLGHAIQLLDPGQVQAFLAAVARLPEAPVFVVIDTLGRSMNGGDENANSDIHRVIAAADAIRTATGATVLLCHHDGKDQGRGARGGSALGDDLDTVIQFKRESETTIARCDKQKDYEPFAPFAFRLRRVDLDASGEQSSCVIEQAALDGQRIDPDGNAAPIPADLLPSDVTALECLESARDGMTAGDWQRTCEVLGDLKQRTFYRSRDRLIANGYVERTGDRYRSTGKYGTGSDNSA